MIERERSVLISDLGHASGLRWHAGELWFSDWISRQVTSIDLEGRTTKRAFIPGAPSSMGWNDDGELIVLSMIDQQLVAVNEESRRRSVASLIGRAVGPLNDMFMDANGLAYVTVHGGDVIYREFPTPTYVDVLDPAPIWIVAPSGSVSIGSEPLTLAIGIARLSGGQLIVSETLRSRIHMFDVAEDGQLSNQRLFAELEHWGQGIAVDCEDAVWVAMPRLGKLVRVVEGGRVLEEVPVPTGAPRNPALGGPDGRTLCFAVGYPGSGHPWRDGETRSGIECFQVDIPAPHGGAVDDVSRAWP